MNLERREAVGCALHYAGQRESNIAHGVEVDSFSGHWPVSDQVRDTSGQKIRKGLESWLRIITHSSLDVCKMLFFAVSRRSFDLPETLWGAVWHLNRLSTPLGDSLAPSSSAELAPENRFHHGLLARGRCGNGVLLLSSRKQA